MARSGVYIAYQHIYSSVGVVLVYSRTKYPSTGILLCPRVTEVSIHWFIAMPESHPSPRTTPSLLYMCSHTSAPPSTGILLCLRVTEVRAPLLRYYICRAPLLRYYICVGIPAHRLLAYCWLHARGSRQHTSGMRGSRAICSSPHACCLLPLARIPLVCGAVGRLFWYCWLHTRASRQHACSG